MATLSGTALLCGALLLLSACGGTDIRFQSGGIQSPPILEPAGTGVRINAAAAWHSYLTAPQRWQVAGSSNGNAFTLALVLTPGPIAVFPLNGQLAQSTTESLRLNFAGVLTADTDGTLFYSNDNLIGIGGPGNSCAIVRTPMPAVSPLPGNAAVGDAGTIVTLDNFDGCASNAMRVGSVSLRWSVEQDLAVTLLCLSTLRQDLGGSTVSAQTACVQSTAQGELGGGARLSLRRPDGSVISAKKY